MLKNDSFFLFHYQQHTSENREENLLFTLWLRLRDLKHSLICSDFAIDRTGNDFCKLNSRKRTIFYIPHIQEKKKKKLMF